MTQILLLGLGTVFLLLSYALLVAFAKRIAQYASISEKNSFGNEQRKSRNTNNTTNDYDLETQPFNFTRVVHGKYGKVSECRERCVEILLCFRAGHLS
jgi:Na+-transporting methylmalonyl-CoA/oxaloacetate decarboxylase gamma subunit